MFRNLSLHYRQLLAFLSLVLLMVLIALVSFWSYQKHDTLGKVFGGLEQVSVKTIQTIEYEKDFLLYDATDQNFFETNKSEYLTQHRALMGEIRKDIQELRISSIRADYHIVPELDTISHYLSRHELIFKQIVDLTRIRGFRDFGLEGQMRKYAHQLEADHNIDQVKLLSLRRREKDYILRKDPVYIGMFNQIYDEVMTALKRIPQAERNYLSRQTLLSYKETFARLVDVETKIGIDNNSGMRKQLRQESTQAKRTLRQTVGKTNAEFEVLKSQVQTLTLVSLGLAILGGIVLSYVLTYQVTRSIRELSNHINFVVDRGFSVHAPPEPFPPKNNDEIGDLARNFNLMNAQIYHTLQEVHEKSQELQRQNIELQRANLKLSASESRLTGLNAVKDKFFSIISHDMRGPLTSLTGFLEMFKTNQADFTRQEMLHFIDGMNASVKRIINMLENLLQWSKSQTGAIVPKPDTLELYGILENNIELLRETATRKHITLNLSANNSLKAFADRNMTDFVVRNLIANAIKFTYSGGNVDVLASQVSQFIVVTVRDTGIGIAAADVEKIFQADVHFSTPGTNAETGTGLGLLLCKDFVEKNGGSIQIESMLGKGTSVIFTIPAFNAIDNNLSDARRAIIQASDMAIKL
jgi:signal transduction histidine kinase